MSSSRRVALVTMGCARNEVDSEELAGRLRQAGWELAEDPADADVAVVNTCGFIESAKRDSVDAVLEAADLKSSGRTRAVVAVGCLAERYGAELAQALPEADAVVGFDAYPELGAILDSVLHGTPVPAHAPRDRRTLLPIAPVDRAASSAHAPGHGSVAVAPVLRTRLDHRPWAPVKIASGCDRRCAFCAIPAFRGSFVSRPPDDIVLEARWLAEQGVRELLLVSENSTSYGKDVGQLRALEALLPRLAEVPGIEWVRVSYLQPAEMRPGLLDVLADTPGVVPYFDLSFQHAAPALLRRMRRFGGTQDFLRLVESVRARAPQAGIRSNVIVGFPGETEADLAELGGFLEAARLDVVGVFGYSDEEGTEAESLDGHLEADEVERRRSLIAGLVEELTAQRAEDRMGEDVLVMVEEVEDVAGRVGVVGRSAHQGPEVDGLTAVSLGPGEGAPEVGSLVCATVVGTEGVDLLARSR
ncbi:MAG: 30S ribosomal protein S12 methylthiotransferase RimO [Actinomycetales bacterium]|nr:30S ribosomal protein S12 methylthiotransferase RimO [Candidatus Lutibacillus vidarii]HRC00457.1 30S ribosomal protein S12 methylthiotransferase RimO [Dermatophilaceae bacterium]